MDLRELFKILWRRRLVLLATLVVTTAVAAAFAATRPTEYESTATVAVTPATNEAYVTPEVLNALLGTYAETAKSSSMKVAAEEQTGKPVEGKVETTTQAGTGILQITGNAESAEVARQTATAITSAFVVYLRRNEFFEAQIVDPAALPESPAQPRPPLIIAIGILLGLIGGAMLAYGIDRLRGRVETAADVGEITSIPVVGVIPRDRRLSRGPSRLIWDDLQLTGVQEGIRALRTNIELVEGNRSSVLQITSPLASEGKSLIVANLGVALAEVGIETIIVDIDLRRPTQHEIFRISNDLGVTNLLATSAPIPLRRAATPYENLTVVPSGPIRPNSTELLHVRVASLFEKLRATGAMILIDSPPLLPISDARLLASRSDRVFLTVAAGKERGTTLRSAIDSLEFTGGTLEGIIFNRAVDSSSAYDSYRRQPREAQVNAPVR
jgi:capsular exopolysaccharide synthesis family protein